jgi:hypothetical protein
MTSRQNLGAVAGAFVVVALVACASFQSETVGNADDGGAEGALADALATDAPADPDAAVTADAGPPPCEAKHVACVADCTLSTLAAYGDVAPLNDGALSLALGPNDVFFALNRKDGMGNLFRVRKDGSQGAADVIAKDVVNIGPVAVGPSSVYFTSFDGVTNKTSVLSVPTGAAPCSPSCATPAVLFSDDAAFNARPAASLLAVDDSVFVGSSNGVAVRISAAGTPLRFGSGGAVPLAADPSWVYFGGAMDTRVQRVRHDGTFVATLAAGVTSAEGGAYPGPLSLATNCTSVFATELESPARIFAMPTGAAAPVTPVNLRTLPTGGGFLAADAAYVYFTQPAGTYYADVFRMRLSPPTPPEAIFTFGGGTAETMRGALLLDDTHLYWLNSSGDVRRIGK